MNIPEDMCNLCYIFIAFQTSSPLVTAPSSQREIEKPLSRRPSTPATKKKKSDQGACSCVLAHGVGRLCGVMAILILRNYERLSIINNLKSRGIRFKFLYYMQCLEKNLHI